MSRRVNHKPRNRLRFRSLIVYYDGQHFWIAKRSQRKIKVDKPHTKLHVNNRLLKEVKSRMKYYAVTVDLPNGNHHLFIVGRVPRRVNSIEWDDTLDMYLPTGVSNFNKKILSLFRKFNLRDKIIRQVYTQQYS